MKMKYSLLLFELTLSRRIFSSSSAQRHSLFILFATRIRFPFIFAFANVFVYIYARRVIMSASEMSESKTQEKRNEVVFFKSYPLSGTGNISLECLGMFVSVSISATS